MCVFLCVCVCLCLCLFVCVCAFLCVCVHVSSMFIAVVITWREFSGLFLGFTSINAVKYTPTQTHIHTLAQSHTLTRTQSLQQTQIHTLTHKYRFAVGRGKPWLLLMPQYVSRKGFYLHVRRTFEVIHIFLFSFFIFCFGSLELPAVVVQRPPLQACVFGAPALALRVCCTLLTRYS